MYQPDADLKRSLSERDLWEVFQVSGAIGECVGIDEMRGATLNKLGEALNSHRGNFFITQSPNGHVKLNNCLSRGIDGKFMQRYVERYHAEDPFLNVFSGGHPVITDQKIMPPSFISGSEYYNDFLLPQSIRYELFIPLMSASRSLGFVCFFRSRHDRPFSRVDQAKASLIGSHLASSLDRTILHEQQRRWEMFRDHLGANLTEKGVILLDGSLGTVFHNETFEKISRRVEPGLASPGASKLLAEIKEGCRKLPQAPQSKNQGLSWSFSFEDARSKAPASVKINVRLLCPQRAASNYVATLTIDDLPGRISLKLDHRGISAREREVVSLVCRGLTNQQIAAKLFVSLNTVESHLKSIYRKLGAKNRSSLIYSVLAD